MFFHLPKDTIFAENNWEVNYRELLLIYAPQKLFKAYISALKYLLSVIKEETVLSIYLFIAFLSQIIFYNHLFDNIIMSVIYSIGVFIFVSFAYSIIYYNAEKNSQKIKFNSKFLQIFVIVFAILLHFVITSGQLPTDNVLNNITEPIRQSLYSIIQGFGLSDTLTSILVINSFAVVIPFMVLLLLDKNINSIFLSRINFKVLLLLCILYLPIIVFGQKSWVQIFQYLPVYLLIAAIPEEFLYRGLFQNSLEQYFKNPLNAIVLASLVFGLMHLPINIKMYGTFVGVAACIGSNAFGGILIGYLYYKTRSIWTIIIFHLISGIALS